MHTTIEIDKTRISASNAINNATKWLTSTGGYVIAVKNEDGTWESLIFADAKDPEDWHYLVKINKNGIGFSYDGGQTYRQAWTIDGNLIADFIHGGTLTLGGLDNGNGWMSMLNSSGSQYGKWDNGGLSINGSRGMAQLKEGRLILENSASHDSISMVRGEKEITMGADSYYLDYEDDHVFIKTSWGTLSEIAKYWEDHGRW
jgi:hypothetical protein